jgi:hypothetical protein
MPNWEARVEALRVVDAVEWSAPAECQIWFGPGTETEPHQCSGTAEFLIVLDSDLESRPLNALACAACKGAFSASAEPRRAVTDGGHDIDALREEFGDDAVVELDEPFISGGESFIHGHDPTPELDPESMCAECGDEAHALMCGSCGRPLCSMHAELGAGFCSDFTTDDDERPGCEIAGEFHVAEHMIDDEEAELVTDGGVDVDAPPNPDTVARKAVLRAIDEHGDPAPIATVIEHVLVEDGLRLHLVLDALADLHRRGEVYCPNQTTVRKTGVM